MNRLPNDDSRRFDAEGTGENTSDEIELRPGMVGEILRNFSVFKLPALDPGGELGRKILHAALKEEYMWQILSNSNPELFTFKIGSCFHEPLTALDIGSFVIVYDSKPVARIRFDLQEKTLGDEDFEYLTDTEIDSLKYVFSKAVPDFPDDFNDV